MPEAELFLLFVRPFNRAGIRYVIGGSVAAIFYGEPRLTNDVDFVTFLNEADIQRLPEFFPPSDFYLPPVAAITAEVAREQRGHFNIIHLNTSFKADVYPTGRDELNAWAFRNKRRIEFQGETLVLAPPEYVIIRKLEYFRAGGSEKHLRDIRAMLAVSGEQMDRPALNELIQQRGLQAEWQRASA
ncbi:MAG: hypothetical protein PHY43_08590 [Verrucomicrobiales bacterium]|nr:hypothetical protein [Verrucomicrobiales bacterium]